jgi:hypothetical protein
VDYEKTIQEYAECLDSDSKGVSGRFYGFALDGAILRLQRYFPEIDQCKIVDDLINWRRNFAKLRKETENV